MSRYVAATHFPPGSCSSSTSTGARSSAATPSDTCVTPAALRHRRRPDAGGGAIRRRAPAIRAASCRRWSAPPVPLPVPAAPPAAASRTRPASGSRSPRRVRSRRSSDRLRHAQPDRARFDVLLGCITPIGVDRIGDRQHHWGFLYDERDGTGIDTRPALALHPGRGSRPGTPPAVDRAALPERAADPNGTARTRGSLARRHRDGIRVRCGACTGSSDSRPGSTPAPSASTRGSRACRWLPVTEDGDAGPGPRLPRRRRAVAYGQVTAGHRPRPQRVGRPGLPGARIPRPRPTVQQA